MIRSVTRLASLLALAALLVWTGCDSGGDDVEDANVIGTYTFTSLTFRPDAAVLPAANVLGTLDASQTSLRFFANGRFTLEYRFQNTTDDLLLDGTYNVRGDRVDFDVDGSADDRLLLPNEFRLNALNGGAQLQGDIDLNGIDLSDFSDVYDGIGEINGTLQIRLRR